MIYYIPYDNNLDEYTDSIVNELEAGVGSNTMIAVFIDRYNHFDRTLNNNFYGTRRILLSKNFKKETKSSNELSANTSTFENFLSWSVKSCSFKKYAITFLDHGVGVDKLCADEYPYQKFLRIDSVGSAIERNSAKIGKKPDLIFLQLCSRATAEFLYQLKNCSPYTLCSQTPITAPNAYYKRTMAALSEQKINSGMALANLIADTEKPEMYNSYTLVNNSSFARWRIIFNRFLNSIDYELIRFNDELIVKIYDSGSEFLDFHSLINSIQVYQNSESLILKTELLHFTKDSLLLFHKISPLSEKMKDFCGFSLTRQKDIYFIKNYGHLSFYKDCKIARLYFSFSKF